MLPVFSEFFFNRHADQAAVKPVGQQMGIIPCKKGFFLKFGFIFYAVFKNKFTVAVALVPHFCKMRNFGGRVISVFNTFSAVRRNVANGKIFPVNLMQMF